MMGLKIDRDTYNAIVNLLRPFFTGTGDRTAIISRALRGADNLQANISYSGNANVFTVNLVRQLENYGSFDGKHALIHLLDDIYDNLAGEEDRNTIQTLKARMGVASPQAPASPQAIPTQRPVAPGNTRRDQVFISYSHRDALWMERLKINLKPLMRSGSIRVWDDQNIKPGDKWRNEINTALASARVAVLMVSANFLASDFISAKELPILLDAAENSALRVIWFPVSHSLVKETTDLTEYQGAGGLTPNMPLDSLSVAEQNAALVRIAKDIMEAYNSFDKPDA